MLWLGPLVEVIAFFDQVKQGEEGGVPHPESVAKADMKFLAFKFGCKKWLVNHCENLGWHFTMFPLESLIRWCDIQSFAAGMVLGLFGRGLGCGWLSSPGASSLEDRERELSPELSAESSTPPAIVGSSKEGLMASSKLPREGLPAESPSVSALISLRNLVAMDFTVLLVMMVVLKSW